MIDEWKAARRLSQHLVHPGTEPGSRDVRVEGQQDDQSSAAQRSHSSVIECRGNVPKVSRDRVSLAVCAFAFVIYFFS